MSQFGQIPGVRQAKGGKGGKKGKAKKNEGPKKARAAYAFFMQGEREKIAIANPDATFGEIAKLVGTKWKAYSDEDKQVYTAMADEDKKRAADEKSAYDAKMKTEKEERGEVSSESEDTSSSSSSSSDDSANSNGSDGSDGSD